MKIIIASDHAGIDLKDKIINHLKDYTLVDVGTNSKTSVDYPDYAKKVATDIAKGFFDFGILICGSGIGMSIAANRVKRVRAALCHSVEVAKLSRKHNNANVLCLGARTMEESQMLNIVDAFLSEEFEGGRHIKRLDKLEI